MQELIFNKMELSQRLIESSIDGILAFDSNCCYTIWNSVMERISGKKASEVLGKYAFSLFPFLKQTGEDQYFYKALKGETIVVKDRPYRVDETDSNGFFEGYYSPIRDEQGSVIGGLGIIRDITDNKQAVLALEQSKERYSTLINTMQEGLVEVDESWNMIFINERFLDMTGYHEEDIINTPFFSIISEESAEIAQYQYQIRQKGKNELYEIKLKKSDGETMDVLCSPNPSYDSAGRYTGGFGVISDITKRKNVEQQLKDLNATLEEKVKERTSELEELNTALKVLLKKRGEDKAQISENIFSTHQSLISPLIYQLSLTLKNEHQSDLLSIIERTIRDVLSPFSRKMTNPMVNLTPSEILVAQLVKEGKTTKEIAQILNRSIRVIRLHRGNIRNKLGLKNKKTNLRSYLLMLK